MMHDARRITDARTSSIESDRELQFPVWRDSVASTKRHFLSLYRFAFWVGSHRRAVRSASSLFLPLFNERERHRFDRKRSRRDGATDGRKERSNYTEQSARINSHHSRTLISICGRPRGCQSIMDRGNISTQDLSSCFLRIHYSRMPPFLRQFQSRARSGAVVTLPWHFKRSVPVNLWTDSGTRARRSALKDWTWLE